MTVDLVVELANKALYIVILTSAPVLLVSLVIGLIVSIFQTATSIQEQTLDKPYGGHVVGFFYLYQVMDHDRV